MGIEAFAGTTFGKLYIKFIAAAIESRFRYRFFEPKRILQGIDNLIGQEVLEIGCGTGFFTIPAAQMIGEQGKLISMDILPGSVEFVSKRVQEANLQNVNVIKGDALTTGLENESFDSVILFGVIPAPMLPLTRLLSEIHRVLKSGGNLAVWPPIPLWLPKSILKSRLFKYAGKRNHVYNFSRS